MRIALAQTNPIVGDIAGNCRKIIDFAGRAKRGGAELVVFPELAVIGYPPKDLLLKPQFIDENIRAVNLIATRIGDMQAIIGYADRNPLAVGRPLHNAVAIVRGGKVVGRHFKTLLPTYDVFDETRYFEPGPADQRNQLVRIGDVPMGLSICEDLWNDERSIPRRLYHQNPIAELHAAGAQVMINSSASPYVVGKHEFRLRLFSSQAKQFQRPLVYVNQVGGNDELVFDGNSVAFDAAGNVIAQAKDFEEDLLFVEVAAEGSGQRGQESLQEQGSGVRVQGSGTAGERGQESLPGAGERGQESLPGVGFRVQGSEKEDEAAPGRIEVPSVGIASIHKALVLGLRDYVRKCFFKSVVLGLSGGIDSAVTAALAVAALGSDKVVGVGMPSRFSSGHSVSDAQQLAQNLGIEFHIVPIGSIHDAYERTLAEAFAGKERDVTEENIQARVRGGLLMAFSNKFNHLLLTTGNKSEMAVGYCTLYGDMCGGLAVISDVPKTTVYELARYINAQAGRDLIPPSSITKPPSAELRPNQTDQDSLPPYDLLDAIMHRYVEEDKSTAEIIAEGFDGPMVLRVIKLIDRSEYKRRQAPPGIKVTSRAFGFGRRMPIAQNYQQVIPKHGDAAVVQE